MYSHLSTAVQRYCFSLNCANKIYFFLIFGYEERGDGCFISALLLTCILVGGDGALILTNNHLYGSMQACACKHLRIRYMIRLRLVIVS